MFKEEWKPIVGFEDKYEVSNLGDIRRTYESTGPLDRGYVGKQLKPRTNNSYIRVSLGNGKSYAVHRLVAEAFLPNPEGKKTVNHKDGNKSNNRLDNLEWNTHSENVLHAHDTGLNNCNGESHHNSKFTEEQVLWLRANYDGTTEWIKEQAMLHNTLSSHIRDILSGKRWSRVGGLAIS